MSTIDKDREAQLRKRLKHAPMIADEQGCSLYLVVLGCAYLACNDDDLNEEAALEILFKTQASQELVTHTERETQEQRQIHVNEQEVIEAIAMITLATPEPS